MSGESGSRSNIASGLGGAIVASLEFGIDSGRRMYTSSPRGDGDLVLKELSEAATTRIHAAQELAFVEAKGDGVICLPRPGLPRWLLTSQNDCEPIEIGHHAPLDWLVEREEPGLMSQKLPDCDSLLSLLRELRPVPAHTLFIVEPPREWAMASVMAARPLVAE